jgi:hypothetical protein
VLFVDVAIASAVATLFFHAIHRAQSIIANAKSHNPMKASSTKLSDFFGE